jgi:hypothetical protein
VSSFLYFFPSREIAPSRDHLSDADRAAGLDAVWRDGALSSATPAKGPAGQTGSMVMVGPDATSCLYDEKAQTWRKVSDHYWIGYWNDQKPTATTLKRPTMIDGETVEIDGQEWVIPVCGPAYRTLPTVWRKNGVGWKAEVHESCLALMQECEGIQEDIRRFRDDGFDLRAAQDRQLNFAARMIAVNYHVGDEEISALALLNDRSFIQIIKASNGRLTHEREIEREKTQAAAAIVG